MTRAFRETGARLVVFLIRHLLSDAGEMSSAFCLQPPVTLICSQYCSDLASFSSSWKGPAHILQSAQRFWNSYDPDSKRIGELLDKSLHVIKYDGDAGKYIRPFNEIFLDR